MQFGIGAIISPMVGVLGNDSVAMATVIFGGLGTALVVLLAVVRPWRLTDDTAPAPALA
jgi:DHA1 family bicyclomycin/chloramphenicol resistance-like MFS transporter